MTIFKFPSQEVYKLETSTKIYAIKRLIASIKSGIENLKAEDKNKLDEKMKNISDEEDFAIYQYEEMAFEIEYIDCTNSDFQCSQLEKTASYSLITICYMVFETHFSLYSEVVKKIRMSNIRYNDFHGGKIEKIKVYFQKIAEIDVSKYDEWEFLISFDSLRNCIVHNQGLISEVSKIHNNIKKLEQKHPDGIFISNNEIFLKLSLCMTYIEMIESFFEKLNKDFCFHTEFYFGEDAVKQRQKEENFAKEQYRRDIKAAKERYKNRIKLIDSF